MAGYLGFIPGEVLSDKEIIVIESFRPKSEIPIGIIKALLGEMLHMANSYPPTLFKHDFYRLKDNLLMRYGTTDGFDLQHIVKHCYQCEGEAGLKCSRCGGTGIYNEFWVHLIRYDLGRRKFHLPAGRYYTDPKLTLQRAMIDGYIEHKRYAGYLTAEAFFWLCLLFDLKLFWKSFGHWGMPSMKYTPMVILADLFWNVRMQMKHIKNWRWKLRRTLIRFRQRLCKHDFPEGDYSFDVCPKCEAERWEVSSAPTIDEFPF
jgi:hypothetical protein